MEQGYIAVFDSGVGGLSVLRHLRQRLPAENFLYFGDCANAPYGSRSTQQVRQLTMEAVDKLLQTYPVKALVIACNTATSAAITQLRQAYPHRIIIGIEPALKLAADHFPGGRIGVMATQVTLREEKFDALLQRYSAGCPVAKIPAPGLVELIEAGLMDTPRLEALLRSILQPYVGALDALVLGCTHYPFVAQTIRKVLGAEVALLDGGDGTARETQRRLQEAGLLRTEGQGQLLLTCSGDRQRFLEVANRLMTER